jgi:hypothetical protein
MTSKGFFVSILALAVFALAAFAGESHRQVKSLGASLETVKTGTGVLYRIVSPAQKKALH